MSKRKSVTNLTEIDFSAWYVCAGRFIKFEKTDEPGWLRSYARIHEDTYGTHAMAVTWTGETVRISVYRYGNDDHYSILGINGQLYKATQEDIESFQQRLLNKANEAWETYQQSKKMFDLCSQQLN